MFYFGIDDDNLALLYEANKNVKMSVKTTNGLTERQILRDVVLVLQGDTFGSILASVQVDNICKSVVSSGYGYSYKDVLGISVLALVDDMIGVTKAGHEAHQMNAVINSKTAEKRLQFGVTKCKTMLIGENHETSVENNNLAVDTWKVEYDDEINLWRHLMAKLI